MTLEAIIQGEVSQEEKDKYRILAYIRGILEDGTDEPVCRAAVERQAQRTDLWTGGEGEGEADERVALRH